MGSVITYITYQQKTPINYEESVSEYETDEGEQFFESEVNCSEILNQNMATDILNNDIQTFDNQVNLRTDAIENKKSFLKYPSPSTITTEQVEKIEKDLDFYEKVSLVFLLYEHADIALQEILLEESYETNKFQGSKKLIWNWARSKLNKNWQNELLEALCIIQNYAIAQKLGFDKEELIIRYLPDNKKPLFINSTRRILYYICENLSKARTKEFILHLRKDFSIKSLSIENYNENYLEMYFLHCFSMHYINNDDLTNVIKIFKIMELDVFCDILSTKNKSINSNRNNNVKNKNNIPQNSNMQNDNVSENIKLEFDLDNNTKDQNYNRDNKSFSDNSTILDSFNSTKSHFRNDQIYKMDPDNPGICLIINQKVFYKETKTDLLVHIPHTIWDNPLENRDGTDFDKNTLKKTFEYFGFQVIVSENLTHEQIESEIEKVMKRFLKKHCCLIVCILSHGYEDHIFGVNSIPVPISSIEETLYDRKYPNILGKPKIVIIQSCQGAPLQEVYHVNDESNTTDGLTSSKKTNEKITIFTDGPSMTPARADLLVCSSTIPGFASIRHKELGSWYIQELCKIVKEKGCRLHFEDILSFVNDNVSRRYCQKEGKIVTMVPRHSSSFRKKLYLPVPEIASTSYS